MLSGKSISTVATTCNLDTAHFMGDIMSKLPGFWNDVLGTASGKPAAVEDADSAQGDSGLSTTAQNAPQADGGGSQSAEPTEWWWVCRNCDAVGSHGTPLEARAVPTNTRRKQGTKPMYGTTTLFPDRPGIEGQKELGVANRRGNPGRAWMLARRHGHRARLARECARSKSLAIVSRSSKPMLSVLVQDSSPCL